jgi:hypothetical protein
MIIMKKEALMILLFLLTTAGLIFLISCNIAESDWKKAKEKDNIETYKQFISDHPDSEYIVEAQNRLDELEYTWEDGYLNRQYTEDQAKVEEALSVIINPNNAIIVNTQRIENGSLMTYLGSTSGTISFTSDGVEGGIAITVKRLHVNGTFILGIKVNDGDKEASLGIHKTIQDNLK